MNFMLRILCSVFLVATLFSCTQQLAGNGSEITNGYCVASASPADSAMVVAYPNDYLPYPPSGKPETTFTDKNGHFALCLGRKGWNLVIYDRLQVFGAFVPLPRGDSAVDTVVLRGVGGITAIVNDTAAVPRIVGIIGSPFYARITGTTDTFSITKIPAFYYNLSRWQWLPNTSGTLDERVFPVTNIGLKGGSATLWVQPDSTTNITIYP
jgi:hypothetical protein